MSKLFSWILWLIIKAYQLIISPFFPASCRYAPSCSEYAKQALLKHGPFYGLFLAVKRILRCNPWWGGSGHDPVP